MFDLITGKATHAPRNQTVPILVSIGAHVSVIGTLLLVTVLFVGNEMPAVPEMMRAFIAAPPTPPPPPPPAAPARPRTAERPAAATNPNAAPIEPPAEIAPEAPVPTAGIDDEGVPGGVVGGVPGGVIAGIVGGAVDALPPPPPRAPVRVGGDVKAPALLHRVEPVYPPVAVAAHVEATIILEATVNELGFVENVRVLRSNKLLDQAAVDAVQQWRYSPLTLNGRPASFVLTVVLTFALKG